MSSSFGLRSTGLIVFSGRLVSAFTGLVFTLMAARVLGSAGFGVVEVVVTFVTFGSYPVGTIAYWATRDTARGRMVGRTALASSALLSLLGLLIYFGFSLSSYASISASFLPFLLGALLVPLSYWNAAASALVTGYRPSVYGTSLLFSEAAKLAVAYGALYVYRLGIEGAIVAIMAAYFVQSLVSIIMVRNTVTEGIDRAELKRWSSLAWLPALSYLPASLAVADTYVVALVFHGTANVGTYQAAFTVASIVTYASGLVFSMYPLLLKGGDLRLPAISMEFSLMFAIPMAVGCAVLAGPILYFFGPEYVAGATGLAILAVMFLFNNISLLVDQTLTGTEKVDAGPTPSFRNLLGSNLIFVPVANIGFGVVYLFALFTAVSLAAAGGLSSSAVVAIWATVQFAATVVFMLYKAKRARRYASLMPGVSVAHYLAAAAVMAVVLRLASGIVVVQGVGTIAYGSSLLVMIAVGAAVYFGVLYPLDHEFRALAWAFLHKMKRH